MKLNFKCARHFWKNGRDATWEVAEGFPTYVLDWLKENYPHFEEKRPKYETFQNSTIFFFYNDTQDIFGRDIIEITFWYVKYKFLHPEIVYTRLKNKACSLKYERILSFNVEKNNILDVTDVKTKVKGRISDKYFKSKQLVFIGITVISLVVLSFNGFFLNNAKRSSLSIPEKKNIIETNNKIEKQRKNHKKDNIMNKLLKDKEAKIDRKDTFINDFCRKYNKIDKHDEKLKTNKCFFTYIKYRCNSKNNKLYSKWLEENRSLLECRYVQSAFEDQDLLEWLNHLSRKERKDAKKFFYGEKKRYKN